MRPGEVCHYQTAASVLQVKNEVVGHTSGYRGMSIHVAKGLTLHTGGSRGHAIRADVAPHLSRYLYHHQPPGHYDRRKGLLTTPSPS